MKKVLGGADAQPAGGPSDLSRDASQPVGAHQAQGDWIEWAGGECPVPHTALVLIRTRDGWEDRTPELASLWSSGSDWWQHQGDGENDIIAYRVIGGAS